jgi:predicted transcriptional regulator
MKMAISECSVFMCAIFHKKNRIHSKIVKVFTKSLYPKVAMIVSELIQIIEGKLLTNTSDLSQEIKGGCGADLMSDVLASIQPEAVLLTGLCNPQVVRTAQMADVAAIVLVRGKCPPKETIELANKETIPLISSPFGMFELCGRLFQAGMSSLEMPMNCEDCDCDCG